MKKAIPQRPFPLSFGEHPETLNAITRGKRRLSIALASKIEEKSSLEKRSMALLQTCFEIKDEKSKIKQNTPELTLLRKSIF